MLNLAPIFVNGFSRGGSNILVNLFLSHPDVCSPSGEIQEVFRGGARIEALSRKIFKRAFYNAPISLLAMQPLFSTSNLKKRPLLSQMTQKYVDWVLYREKLAARHEWHNRYIREGEEYTRAEIEQSRLLCKSLNGLVFMTDNFASMYPDASFFGLIRNGLAVCEGQVRRGRTPEEIGQMYNRIVTEMVEKSEQMKNYRLIRFEDILKNPIEEMKRLHNDANLDGSKIEKIRLQLKAVLTESGQHKLRNGYDRQVVWYGMEEVESHFNSDIDEIQIENLSERDRDTFLGLAGNTMQKLGYI